MKKRRLSPDKLILSGKIRELDSLHKFVHKFGVKNTLDSKTLFDIELAADEAVTNIIRHGLKGKKGRITIEIAKNPGKYTVKVTDNAPHFDQSIPTHPNLSSDITERAVGGLGIYLIHQVMDSVSYSRSGDKNILVFEKKLK
ncbi:MAG: ATP-binding protein [bacterium]|nr:ATP-binding protein [bacterium]